MELPTDDRALEVDLPPPFVEEPEEGPRPSWTPRPVRVAAAIAAVAVAVAIERLTMIAVITEPGPLGLAVSGVLFLSVPLAACAIGLTLFARARRADDWARAARRAGFRPGR